MADRQSQIRLQTYMADVMELENDAQKRLRTWGTSVSLHPEVRTVVNRLRALIHGQTETWRARMQAVGGKYASSKLKNSGLAIRVPAHRGANTISATLHEITTTCAHLSFAYAKVHAIAHRFFDRTTVDLAEKNMRAYASVVRDINGIVHSIDPEQPIAEIRTLAQVRNDSLAPSRLVAVLIGLFATLAFASWRVGLGFLAIPLLIAFSRMYVAAHHLSDVVGAALIGLGVAYFVVRWRQILIGHQT